MRQKKRRRTGKERKNGNKHKWQSWCKREKQDPITAIVLFFPVNGVSLSSFAVSFSSGISGGKRQSEHHTLTCMHMRPLRRKKKDVSADIRPSFIRACLSLFCFHSIFMLISQSHASSLSSPLAPSVSHRGISSQSHGHSRRSIALHLVTHTLATKTRTRTRERQGEMEQNISLIHNTLRAKINLM